MNEGDAALHRTQNVAAYLTFVENGVEAALRELPASDVPATVETQLKILIDAGQIEEAAGLVQARPIQREWCAQGIRAAIEHGDVEKAEGLLTWCKSQQDKLLRTKCAIAYGTGAYMFAMKENEGESRLLPGLVTQRTIRVFELALSALRPLLHVVEANEGVETQLEEQAVRIALVAAHCIGRTADAQRYGELLATRTPVPLSLGVATLHRKLTGPLDLPDRLRKEHSGSADSFEAHLLAALIEALVQGNPSRGFGSALALVTEASTANRGNALLEGLREIVGRLGEKESTVVDALAPVLARDNSDLQNSLRAETLLRASATAEARRILEDNRDEHDPRWLQLYATCLLQAGERSAALQFLLKACKKLPHPSLLRRTAVVAQSEGQLELAEERVRTAISLDPEDKASRQLLAVVLSERGLFRSAAQEFQELSRLEPEVSEHRLNQATALIQAGDKQGALAVYEALGEGGSSPLAAVLGKSHVLRSLGRVKDAFAFVLKERGRFWGDVEYLVLFVDLGFAAGEEHQAHEAFAELVRRKNNGELPAHILREATLDDVKAHVKEFQERRVSLLNDLLRGTLPWLLVDQSLGKVSYWAWGLRTQSLGWVFEDRLTQADFTVYATNRYRVLKRETGELELTETVCPPRGSRVVVDWTALITLHQLRLLDVATRYFDKLFVPTSYQLRAMEEASRLVPHQLSRQTSVDSLHAHLEAGDIETLGMEGARESPQYPELDEYAAEAGPDAPYRFRDLLNVLYGIGSLSKSDFDRAWSAAHVRAATTEGKTPLEPGGQLICTLSSLEALHQLGVLAATIQSFRVLLRPEDVDEIRGRRRLLSFQEKLRSSHNELWDLVASNGKFAEIAEPSSDLPATDKRARGEPILDALRVACDTCVPLFADDRCTQQLVLNFRNTVADAAFGTSEFLVAAVRSGDIGIDTAADAWDNLLTWRYRFLIPPSAVVKHWAAQFRETLPGEPLRKLARYAHESVGDPGLLCGRENTTDPSSVAIRLYQDWIASIAEAIVEVWSDEEFSEDAARSFTRWSVTRLVPPPPRNLGYRDQATVVALMPKSLLGRLAIYSVSIKAARATGAIECAAQALGVSGERLERIVTDVIDVG